MNAYRSFIMGLLVLMLTAMLLTACGDSPTPAPAATTAAATTTAPTVASTTAVATTAAPTTAVATTAAPTTAAPTTVAPTTVAPTTAAPTTAPATGVLPVPAGTRALKLSPTLTKALIAQFATGAGTTNVTFEGYISNQNPVDLSTFYDQKLVELGYTTHPETQKGQQQGNVSFLSASFTKAKASGAVEATSIALIGPVDAATITEIAGFETGAVNPDTDVTKQLKAGDTVIMSFVFSVPATAVAQPTTAAATVAPASGSFPVPAGTRPLTLSAVADKAVFGDFGSTSGTGMSAIKISTFVVADRADKVSLYYDQAMTTIGYAAHPETNTGSVTNNVSLITQNYTKGNQDTYVVLVGPLDTATIDLMVSQITRAGATDDITKQLKVGESIVRAYEGTYQTATTTAAATVAPAASAIPLPASTKPVQFSAGLAKLLSDEFAQSLQGAKLTAYVSSDDPDILAQFFDQKVPAAGYTAVPDSQNRTEQDGVTILTAGFIKGNAAVVVALFGPMDQASIDELAKADLDTTNPATSVKSQIKAGDTVVFVINGTK